MARRWERCLETEITEFARVEHWTLSLNSEEPVPALLLHPLHEPPRGIVLYCHAHGNRFDMGKDELLKGRPALQSPPHGEVLPAMRYAVLAIDHWCFGGRAVNSPRVTIVVVSIEPRTRGRR